MAEYQQEVPEWCEKGEKAVKSLWPVRGTVAQCNAGWHKVAGVRSDVSMRAPEKAMVSIAALRAASK